MNSPWNCFYKLTHPPRHACGIRLCTPHGTHITPSLFFSLLLTLGTRVHEQRERERERENIRRHEALAALRSSLFLTVSRFLPSFPARRRSVTGFSVGTSLLLRGIHVSLLLLRTWLAYVQAGTSNVEGDDSSRRGKKGRGTERKTKGWRERDRKGGEGGREREREKREEEEERKARVRPSTLSAAPARSRSVSR